MHRQYCYFCRKPNQKACTHCVHAHFKLAAVACLQHLNRAVGASTSIHYCTKDSQHTQQCQKLWWVSCVEVKQASTWLAGDTALALRQRMGPTSTPISLANTSSIAAANDDYFAASAAISQALSQLQLSLGTAAPSSLSLYLEPAFFP